MNLNKIIKNMDILNTKQKEIQKKYSHHNKKRNVYYSSLKSCDEEDLKIYGIILDNF